jgi:RNA ligase
MSTIRALVDAVQSPTFDPKRLGRIAMQQDGDLVILNYTDACLYGGDWNDYERLCRGLILNRVTGEVVALPFSRFANYGEEYPAATAKIVSITEKVDGSLAIFYRTPNGPRIATRGSFHSEQAEWATEFLRKNYPCLCVPTQVTLLFEIVYKANRVVIDYGDTEALYLLAVMDRYSFTEWSDSTVDKFAGQWGFPRPAYYRTGDIEEVLTAAKALDSNHEGWVVKYDDGTRFKIKGDQYRQLHRILSEVSFRHTVESILAGTLDDTLAILPDEYRAQVKQWGREIEDAVSGIQRALWDDIPVLAELPTRKDKAIWIMTNRKERAALYFSMLDERDTRPIILKRFMDNGRAEW